MAGAGSIEARSTQRRHAEEQAESLRLEARTAAGACFETAAAQPPQHDAVGWKKGGFFARLARFTALCLVLVTAATALSAAIFAATEKAPAALVFGLRSMPEGMSLLRLDGPMAVVASDSPGYVGRLYAAGAIVVLPFRKNGCMGAVADQRLASVAMRSASAASTVPISQR